MILIYHVFGVSGVGFRGLGFRAPGFLSHVCIVSRHVGFWATLGFSCSLLLFYCLFVLGVPRFGCGFVVLGFGASVLCLTSLPAWTLRFSVYVSSHPNSSSRLTSIVIYKAVGLLG